MFTDIRPATVLDTVANSEPGSSTKIRDHRVSVFLDKALDGLAVAAIHT